MPDDELLTLPEIAARLGRPKPTNSHDIRQLCGSGMLVSYHSRRQWVFGNPRALKALKRHLNLL